MALGTPTYPTTLDTAATLGPTSGIVAGTTPLNATGSNQGDQLGITNNLIAQVIAVETVVGVPGSAVSTSLDYRVRKFPWKVWTAGIEATPPATLYGVFVTRNVRPLLAFNDSATWTALFFGVVPPGSVLGSGVIIRIKWMAATATTGAVVWGVALERLNTDQDADSFDTQGTATTTTAGTAGITVETAITLTTIDSVTAGDGFALQVQRIGANGSDTMTGDAQIQTISIESAA